MESFKKKFNAGAMWFCFCLYITGIVVFVSNYNIPEEIKINKYATYTEGRNCVINMHFTRDVNNISRDMARCMNQHALAIHKMLNK